MNIAATRQAIADALNTISGLVVRPRRITSPKMNDGWVIIGSVEPSPDSFAYCSTTFIAVVVLGAEELKAETRTEEIAVSMVNAVTKSPTLRPGNVVLEPVLLPAGDISPAPLYAITLTVALEVD